MADQGPLAIVLSAVPNALPKREELLKLPKFNEALTQLGTLLTELETIDKYTREKKIVTKADFDEMKAAAARRKEIVKAAEETVDPYKVPLRKWIDLVQQAYNIVKNRAEQIKGIADPKMDVWAKADERRRQDEQKKLQQQVDEQNKKQAEQDRKEKIADLKKRLKEKWITEVEYKREMKLIGAEFEEALQSTPAVEVEKTKTGGRTYYHAKCADRLGFIKEFVTRYNKGDMSMLRFIQVDDSELDAVAADLRDDDKMRAMFPCVEARHETKY